MTSTVVTRLARVLSVTAAVVIGCGDGADSNRSAADRAPGDGDTSATATPVPPRSKSRFRNASENVNYVGSQRCAECHANQHATWAKTAHSRSMSRVTPEDEPPDTKFAHDKSGRAYEVVRVESRLHHRESLVLQDGTRVPLADHQVDYLVGSGRFSRTYLVELDGTLVESPVTWYAQRKAWDMSPGYDHMIHDSFRRRATHGCLMCHAGLVEPRQPQGFTFPHNELSIGCERCHGPGSLHARRHAGKVPKRSPDAAGPSHPEDPTIVHPGRLDRPLAEAICQQCHLQGDVKVTVRGRRPGDFRPGLPLSDQRIEFRLTGASSEMTVVGHVDQLRASRCYQQDQRLSCMTCHDPHDPHHPRDTLAQATFGRNRCLECHQPTACGEDDTRRQATLPLADSCTVCHMPQVDTDIPHIAFTHHRIAVHRKTSDTKSGLSDDSELKTIQDLSRFSDIERDRILGLGYYRLHFQRPWSHDRFLARADRLLATATKKISGDTVMTAARAEIAWEARRVAEAGRLADEVISSSHVEPETRAAALHVKVQILLERQNLRKAVPLLEELTRLRRNPIDWALLGHCHSKTGKTTEAIAAFEKVLTIAPGQGAIHQALAPLYQSAGDNALARKHRSEARRLPPGGFRPR